MFDHIGIRASDREASEAFFLRALAPLGIGLAMKGPHGAGTLHSQRNAAARSMRSTVQRRKQAAKTTVRQGCARTTTLTITPPSSLDLTVITSRLYAICQRIDLCAVLPLCLNEHGDGRPCVGKTPRSARPPNCFLLARLLAGAEGQTRYAWMA